MRSGRAGAKKKLAMKKMKKPLNVRMHNRYETQRASRRIFNQEAQIVTFFVSAFAAALGLFILIVEIFKITA